MTTEELKNKIISYNDAYRSGNAMISDSEYDNLLEKYESLVSEEDYSKFRDTLNEKNIEYGTKIKHKFIMGSLDKIKNSDDKSLKDYINKFIKTSLNISAKVDGISSVAHYVNGRLVSLATRGDGYEGVICTDKAEYIKNLPLTIKYNDELFVRGELVILNSENINSDTNYRNICAGYMNSKYWNKDDISKISFIPYSILGEKYTKKEQFELLEVLGFNTAWHITIDTKQNNLSEVLTEYAKLEHEYSCDGLVLIDNNAYNEQDIYRPKNSKAFKINELNAVTKVIDISWEGPSKNGYFIPVFMLEPVELGGAMISRASAANLDILNELNVKCGSIVSLTKANDIIPHINNVIENPTGCIDIELPTECSCCGSKLVKDGVNLRCTNKDCKDQIIAKLTFFIKKLGVKNCSFSTLDNFGIHSFKNLIDFKPNKKYKMEVKLYDELCSKVFTKSKQELLAATDFCGVGETLVNKIVDFYGLDNIINNDYSKGYPNGIGELMLQRFKDDIIDNLNIVKMFTDDNRYNYLESTSNTSNKAIKNGMSICFTGSLKTMSRNDAIKKAEIAGFEIKSGVSKGLTYLCTNDTESGSSKNEKAKKLGTKIINENEFLSLVSNETVDIMSF